MSYNLCLRFVYYNFAVSAIVELSLKTLSCFLCPGYCLIGIYTGIVPTLMVLNHAAVNAEERHSVPENSSMVSYGKLCNCGGVNYLLSTSYGEWVNASEEKCTSHTYGTDIIQTRSAAKTYRCSSCSKGYVEHLMETKRVCHGYDY